MTTCCTINENGLNLQQKLGLSLGSTTGPFSWPYAACTGKVAKNGIFRPLNIKEAYNVCISFCKKQKDITGKDPISEEFEDLSRIYGAKTGTQQCMMIKNTYTDILNNERSSLKNNILDKHTSIDSFVLKKINNYPFWILPLILFSSILLSIILLQK